MAAFLPLPKEDGTPEPDRYDPARVIFFSPALAMSKRMAPINSLWCGLNCARALFQRKILVWPSSVVSLKPRIESVSFPTRSTRSESSISRWR